MLCCKSHHPNSSFNSLADSFCSQSSQSDKEETCSHETELQKTTAASFKNEYRSGEEVILRRGAGETQRGMTKWEFVSRVEGTRGELWESQGDTWIGALIYYSKNIL